MAADGLDWTPDLELNSHFKIKLILIDINFRFTQTPMQVMKWLLILVATSFLCDVQSQNVDSNYIDGVIYFKIKDSSQVVLDPYVNPIAPFDSIVSKYRVQSFKKAFKHTALKLQKIYRLKFDHHDSVDQIIRDMHQLSFIEYAEKAPLYKTHGLPSDYDAVKQWELEKINAPKAWEASKGNNSVAIAIIDNGVSYTHEDLMANAWKNPSEIPNNGFDDDFNGYTDDIYGYDVADDNGNPTPPSSTTNQSGFIHGTHVAGTASGVTNNNKGMTSLSYNVKFISVKCASDNTDGKSLTHAYEGVDYALTAGADVINMSFGGAQSSATWEILLSQAQSQGIVLVASAGNDNTDQKFYPAAYNGVISVAATNKNDELASFSNYGNWIDVCAPGVNLYSCLVQSGNTYGTLSGTSMAAPVVSALAALIKSSDLGSSASQIQNAIVGGCKNINAKNPGLENQLGSGRIDAFRSLQIVNPTAPVFSSSKTNSEIAVQFYGPQMAEIKSNSTALKSVKIFDASGKKVREIDGQNKRSIKMEFHTLPSGIYFLEVKTIDLVKRDKFFVPQ
jgi:hypothetical protein